MDLTLAEDVRSSNSQTDVTSIVESALERHRPTLAAFTQKLDQASADIKQLEKQLKSFGICIPCFHKVESKGFFYKTSYEYRYEKVVGLGWFEDESGFRIMYVEAEIQCDEGPDGEYIPRSGLEFVFNRKETPLIETKASVRLEMHKNLPDFVGELSSAIDCLTINCPF